MDSCTLCGSTITENYFRVRNKMSCAACATVIATEANRDPTPFILKGILYAFPAAVAGAFLRSAFEGLMMFAGGLSVVGMFLRWFVFTAVATIIVGAAKVGSRGRSGPALRVSSVIFYYLAVTLAFIPILFSLNPKLPVNVTTVWVVSLLCLKLPFSSILRNPFNITGLLAILFCMGVVWVGTAAEPNPVDGPFEVAPPGIEPNFFKRRALPSAEKSGEQVSG